MASTPDGAQLYDTYCSSCHALSNVDPAGHAGDIAGASVSDVKTFVREGGDGMPSMGQEQLSDAELVVLAEYVHAGYKSASTPTPTPIDTDEVTETPGATEAQAPAQSPVTEEKTQSTPGFAIVLSLVALTMAALLIRR